MFLPRDGDNRIIPFPKTLVLDASTILNSVDKIERKRREREVERRERGRGIQTEIYREGKDTHRQRETERTRNG